jgi:hypothetical protein
MIDIHPTTVEGKNRPLSPMLPRMLPMIGAKKHLPDKMIGYAG